MTCDDDWILLVENSDAHARIATRAIEQCGLTAPVHLATDAEAALPILFNARRDQRLPFLLLLSLSLPGLDGLDTLRLLHDEGLTTDITVVITSRISDDTLPDRCTQLGAAAYLVESPSGDHWVDRLRTLPAVSRRLD